jgi:hypothetical protein
VYSTQNDFTQPDSRLARPAADRVLDPGSFTFQFYPDLDSGPAGVDGAGAAGEIGPTRDYWVSSLKGRDSGPGVLAAVVADSEALPQPIITASEHTSAGAPGPTGYVEQDETWTTGPTPPARQAASLRLTNVAAATVNTVAAGLSCGVLTVTTDGPTALTLTGLESSSTVTSGETTVTAATRAGTATVALSSGTTALRLCTTRASGDH